MTEAVVCHCSLAQGAIVNTLGHPLWQGVYNLSCLLKVPFFMRAFACEEL